MIIHGDSQDMSMVNDCSVDMIITSPPYDNLRDYNGSLDWNFNVFTKVAKECVRVLKDGGVIVRIVGDQVVDNSETLSSFRQALYFVDNLGMKMHDTMIREKNTSAFPARKDGNRYTQIFEYMFVLSKGKPKTHNLISDKKNKWAGYTSRGTITKRDTTDTLEQTNKTIQVSEYSPRNNIWKVQSSKGSCGKDKFTGHPAGFPSELVLGHIQTRSNTGDTILDPFAGSGTTGIVCKRTGRDYILIEKEKKYIDIIYENIKNNDGLFG